MPVLNRKSWPAAMALVIGLICAPIFLNPGPLVCLDWPVWWSVTKSMNEEIVPQQRWFWGVLWADGNGGTIQGELYSAAIVLPWLLSQLVSVTVAQKLIYLFTAECLALSGYCFARCFAPRLIACIVGMLVMLRNIDLANDGMWYDSFSIAAALLFAAAAARFIETTKAVYWVTACLAIAASAYSHPLGTIVASAAWFGMVTYVCFRPELRRRAVLTVGLALIPIVSILLASPQVIVLSEYARSAADPQAKLGNLGIQRGFEPAWADFARILVLIAVIPGMKLLWSRRRLWFSAVAVALAVGVAIYTRLPGLLPSGFPFRNGLLDYSDRFDHVADTLLLVLAGATIVWIVQRLAAPHAAGNDAVSSTSELLPASTAAPRYLVGGLIAALVALSGILYLARPHSSFGRLAQAKDLEDLSKWLSSNVDRREARVYCEDTLGVIEIDEPGTFLPFGKRGTHLLGFVAGFAGVQQVNGFWGGEGPFCSLYCNNGGRLFRTPFAELSEHETRETLNRLNCPYVVACSDEGRRALSQLDCLELAAQFGNFAVFQLRDFSPCWAWSGDRSGNATETAIRIERVSPIEFRTITTVPGADDTVIVSAAYARRWKAYAGESELPIDADKGFIRIHVDGAPSGEIQLRFAIPKQGTIVGVSGGASLFLAVVVWIAFRNRRASLPPASVA